MGIIESMAQDKKDVDQTREAPKAEDQAEAEAKRQSMRKRKPLGPVVKPLSKEEIEQLLRDPETRERDNLLDAMPKGYDSDYQDEF
jgi:hypothetical protein